MKNKISETKNLYNAIDQIFKRYCQEMSKITKGPQRPLREDYKSILYVVHVDRAFKSLDKEGRKILDNEFFFGNYQGWWRDLYSRTYFFKLKKRYAMEFIIRLGIYGEDFIFE